MDARTVELAANRLVRLRQFYLHACVLALGTLAATVAISLWIPAALLPLSVLTACESCFVMWAYYAGRDLVQRLALEPAIHDIPAVHRYRQQMLEQPSRDRLARSINSLIADASLPGAICLTDRIALFEGELRLLARELATPEVPVQARSLIACVRLLTHGAESPLFNPGVPVEQLRATLLRIRFGIGRQAID
jgi:hypothetical protein